MIELFEDYTNQFDKMDKEILRKYYHSFRVMNLCELIASKELNEDMSLVRTIGLLHDFGRFEQLKQFQTYDDSLSFDHADLGVKLLIDDNKIAQYNINQNDYHIIYNAIKYHNKREIGEMDERSLTFAKLIRDADKIDIIYIVMNYPKDGIINENIKNSFDKQEQCLNSDVKSNIDKIISTLALIYDLNYDYTFKYIKNNLLIEKFKQKMNDEKLDYYFDKIIEYIEKRLNNVRN